MSGKKIKSDEVSAYKEPIDYKNVHRVLYGLQNLLIYVIIYSSEWFQLWFVSESPG